MFVFNDSTSWIDQLGKDPVPPVQTPAGWQVPVGNPNGGQFIPTPTFNITPINTVRTPGNAPAPSLPSGRGQGASGAASGAQAILNVAANTVTGMLAKQKCEEFKSKADNKNCSSCIVVIGNHNVLQGGAQSPRFSVLLSVSYYAKKKCSDHNFTPSSTPTMSAGPDESFYDIIMITKYDDGSLVNPVKNSPYCL